MTATKYGTGMRVTDRPSTSASPPMPGSAVATRRGCVRVPRASRRRSMITRPAGISVSITIRLMPTPSPATMPKSPTTPIGENRFASRLAMVVTAASTSGTVTLRRPMRTAASTASPSLRCSR